MPSVIVTNPFSKYNKTEYNKKDKKRKNIIYSEFGLQKEGAPAYCQRQHNHS
jgi:hypothetical protein